VEIRDLAVYDALLEEIAGAPPLVHVAERSA